jgi:RNA polymerase sigma-70 factor (ECF subfamily)
MEASAEFIAQFTRAQRYLHTFIISMVWNPSEAEDVLQETNLVLWQKSGEFDPARPFLPWAIRFAQLQTMAWLKKRQRQRVFASERIMALLADEVTAEPTVLERRLLALGDCLQKLRPEQRALVAKRYEPGGSVTAMAAAARATPGAISDRLRRIRLSLQECIERALAREAAL